MVSAAAFPPSFPVTTAAAVAVGQMKHTIAPSSTSWLTAPAGSHASAPAKPRQAASCTASSHPCKARTRSSDGLTLQNTSSSCANTSAGVNAAAALPAAGRKGDKAPASANRK